MADIVFVPFKTGEDHGNRIPMKTSHDADNVISESTCFIDGSFVHL